GALQLRERGAEPLRVRRVLALDEDAQPHHITHQPRRDDRRSKLVAYLARAPDERLLLIEPSPLAGEQVQPYVVRIPSQPRPRFSQLAQLILEDLARRRRSQELRRRREPVRARPLAARIEPERRGDPVPDPGGGCLGAPGG